MEESQFSFGFYLRLFKALKFLGFFKAMFKTKTLSATSTYISGLKA